MVRTVVEVEHAEGEAFAAEVARDGSSDLG
jgi:hypothetical protein